MTDTHVLPSTVVGAKISGADLQESIDRLNAWASSLDATLDTLTDVAQAQAVARVQQDLRSRALSLVGAQIDLITGEATITADHINAATQYAQGVIDQITSWRKRVQKLGKVLDFFTVVVSGNGAKILEAAFALKGQLDTA